MSQPDRSVAVAITLRDEAESVRSLLDALLSQTLPPAEIVITDDGSQDDTVKIIQGYIDRRLPVRIIVVPPSCRGRGRNLAIAATRMDLVAIIDGGCFPEPAWLEQLLETIEAHPDADVVFGAVRPFPQTFFTECASTALFSAVPVPGGRRVMSYSVASMLMRRTVWERVGGFPEGVRSGEDLIFMSRVEKGGFSDRVAPNAVVHWQIPRTFGGTIRRLVNYSQYGLEAGLAHTWHYRTFIYFTLALLLIALGVGYSLWWLAVLAGLIALRVLGTIYRNEKERRGFRAFLPPRLLVIAGILLAADLATLYGTFRWLRDSRAPQSSRETVA